MVVETDVQSPVFQRRQTPFEDRFGVSVGDVLASIAKAGDDPVAGEPRVAIALGRVGYTRGGLLIQIADPFRSGGTVPAVASISVGSGVPASRRGLHLSRIGDAVARSVMEPYPDIIEYARALATSVSQTQYRCATTVDVHARVPYFEAVTIDPPGSAKTDPPIGRGRRTAPGAAPGKVSLEHLDLIARVRVSGRDQVEAGLRVSHLIACPCVQKVLQHTRRTAGTDAGTTSSDPGFTHSQRCETTVVARGLRTPFPVRAALEQIDTVLVRTMNTLPRGSELSLVHAAHARPQFIEDALRDALWAVYQALDGAPFTALRGRSTSAESIHDFDLSASATLTADAARGLAARPRVD